ncbi:nucleotidyltransferase family protein [Agrobacterium sp. 22-226-1]
MWNARFAFSPEHGVSDMDLVYFDPDDLTEESEQKQATRPSFPAPSIREQAAAPAITN